MKKVWYLLAASVIVTSSCKKEEEDDDDKSPSLKVPSEYVSPDYANNVVTEELVLSELGDLSGDAGDAESELYSNPSYTISSIAYPSTLSSVTVTSYKTKVNGWLLELVKAVNDNDGFQNPGSGNSPAIGEEGGLLGKRLLDETGLEIEQMLDKGHYGAACYNHAVSVINGDLSSSSSIDKLVAIFGTTPDFVADDAAKASKYAKRRSNNDNGTGFFYDIKTNLITAKAAIDGGSSFNKKRDNALNDFLLNWEKSNFATVINYCYGAKTAITDASSLIGTAKDEKLGDAMHAYSEAVGFTHGFLDASVKQISNAEINEILTLLLAPSSGTTESFRFLNEAALLSNLTSVEDKIQEIYGFTDSEVASFYENQ